MQRFEIVQTARGIAEEYRAQNLNLTLRQMYYQFVARGLIDNGQKSYKRIGAALTAARYDGSFPVEWIEDRGRDVGAGDFTRWDATVDTALDQAAAAMGHFPYWYLQMDRWVGQDTFVSVWVEKEVLSGVFDDPCTDLGVPLFACKGYPSVSALASWLDMADKVCGGDSWRDGAQENHESTASKAVVLYFGDHDPDGWEIPRSAERNLEKLGESDKGIIMFRRMLQEQLCIVEDGGDPMNVFRDPATNVCIELPNEAKGGDSGASRLRPG